MRSLCSELYRKLVEEAPEIDYAAYDRFQVFLLARKMRGERSNIYIAVDHKQRERLQKLIPGQRVFYVDRRGDLGTGIFLEFIRGEDARAVFASKWGHDKRDAVRVQRSFAVGTYDFRPFVLDGDDVYAQEDFLEKTV